MVNFIGISPIADNVAAIFTIRQSGTVSKFATKMTGTADDGALSILLIS